MERAVGWSQPEPLVMWNPPWTLPLISPLGMLDYDTAQFIWFLLHALIIFVGAQILWQCYTGEHKYARYGLVSVLVFPPIYFALLLGQIGVRVSFRKMTTFSFRCFHAGEHQVGW